MSQLGDGSNVIQVAVGAGYGPDLSVHVLHDAVIRDGSHIDQVLGVKRLHIGVLMNLNPIQAYAHIHYHNIFSYPYRRHIAAYLIVAAHSDYSNILHLDNSL